MEGITTTANPASNTNEGIGKRALLAGLIGLGLYALTKPAQALAQAMASGTTNLNWWVRTSLEGVPADFTAFWQQRGGLEIFGWPISTEGQQALEDGNTYTVMYFERARFERHSSGVMLGQFGRQILAEALGGSSGCSGSAGSPLAQMQPGAVGWGFNLPAHPNLDDLLKVRIEDAPRNEWFHRVFNPSIFNAQNNWAGADSWFVTMAILREVGGQFRSFGNPGQIVFRQYQQDAAFQIAILTTARWKDQFLAGQPGPAQINIRTAPGAPVSLIGPGGDIRVTARASDMGDVSINLPDECRVTISVANRIHDQNGETHIWWGPTGRKTDINLIDGPQYQWG